MQVRAVNNGNTSGIHSGSRNNDDQNTNTSISGYLLKRRAFLGGWARRFFVVNYPHLCYYVSAENYVSGIDARGIFDLSQCNCSKGNGMFDIVLTHKELNKKWILQANSQEEVDKWIDAFRS